MGVVLKSVATKTKQKKGKNKKTPWWRRSTVIANVVFIIAIIGVAIHFDSDENLLQILLHINLWWVVVAVVLQVATYFCFAGLMVATLNIFNKKVKLHTVAALSVAKLFLDQVIPTLGIGGSLMVMQGLTDRKATRGQAMSAMVTEVISRWVAYIIFFFIALVLLWYRVGVTKAVRDIATIFTIFFFAVILIAGYMVWSARKRSLPKWIKNLNFLKPALDALAEVPHKALYSWQLWSISFVLQSAIFILDAATLWASLRALGSHASPLAAFISFMMASAIATLSLIPGGLGFFEGVAIGVLASLGVSVETGLAATLLFRGYTYWIPMIPGFFMFRHEMHKRKDA